MTADGDLLRALRALTTVSVRAAFDDGHQAGRDGRAPTPNPYAPEHQPVHRRPPTGEAAVRRRRALVLARVWRAGYRRGTADRRAER